MVLVLLFLLRMSESHFMTTFKALADWILGYGDDQFEYASEACFDSASCGLPTEGSW